MKNIIIGTAGHIDHGKTTLIKALTGKNTDRLKEEQKRGISIELGFTFFDLPRGKRAGIIDVPGHEKFIKNMLAGVGGMDLVLLVIAADEGIMPQTREHLSILNLMQIKKGIIVLTKSDLADEEWLQMVEEEAREEVKGTFLEGAPIIPVSSRTGLGMDRLVDAIDRMTEEVETRNIDTIYRLNVDRAFTITGFGTIITGTLISGRIEEGQRVFIYPAGLEGRIRNLQVHDKDVRTAYAGQRVAVNLAGFKLERISRGDVMAPPDSLQPTMMMDCRLQLLPGSRWTMANRDRVRLHVGTRELFCRVVLLDREQLQPGESSYVQLRLEGQTVALRGDRFVIRSYSPMETIGGGVVLEPNPPKRRRFHQAVIEELRLKESGSPIEVVEKVLNIHSRSFPGLPQLAKLVGGSREELQPLLEELKRKGAILELQGSGDKIYVHRDYYSSLKEKAANLLEGFHQRHPLRSGMPAEEFRRRLFDGIKGPFVDGLLKTMERDKALKIINNSVSAFDFEILFTGKQQEIRERITEALEGAGYSTPGMDEMVKSLGYKEEELMGVLDAMVEEGEVKRFKDDILFLKKNYDKAVEVVRDYLKREESISLATFRDLLDTSRKYAMVLLEEMDREKITKRTGDHRVLYR